MVDHTVDIKQDGTVNIDIDYRAYVETALKSTRFDALVDREIVSIRKGREEAMKEASIRGCSPKEMVELQKTYEREDVELVKKQHQSIMKRLVERKKLFFVDLTGKSANEFRSNGYFAERPEFAVQQGQGDDGTSAALAESQQQTEERGSTNGSYKIISQTVI